MTWTWFIFCRIMNNKMFIFFFTWVEMLICLSFVCLFDINMCLLSPPRRPVKFDSSPHKQKWQVLYLTLIFPTSESICYCSTLLVHVHNCSWICLRLFKWEMFLKCRRRSIWGENEFRQVIVSCLSWYMMNLSSNEISMSQCVIFGPTQLLQWLMSMNEKGAVM